MSRYEDTHLDDGTRHAGLVGGDCRDCVAYEKRIAELKSLLRKTTDKSCGGIFCKGNQYKERIAELERRLKVMHVFMECALEVSIDMNESSMDWFDDEGNVT